MDAKKCNGCDKVKPVEWFNKNKSAHDGLQTRCNDCRKQHRQANKEAAANYQKQYYQDNKDALGAWQRQYNADNKEAIAERRKQHYQANKEAILGSQKQRYQANKEVILGSQKQYYQDNKEVILERKKQYYQDNKEALAKQKKQYRQDNKDAIAEQQRQYRQANKEKRNAYNRKRYATDPAFRAVISMRNRLTKALDGTAKAASTMDLVGCDRDHLVFHLEQQFTEGMTWQNIHIDHIRPCASFDLTDPEQQRQCFHYTNLQPLWAADNLAKGDKWDCEK